MKQPNLKNLKLDEVNTKRIRTEIAKAKKVKITINLDFDLLNQLKTLAEKRGAPYQTFINHVLKKVVLEKSKDDESRIEKLEKEVSMLKRKFA